MARHLQYGLLFYDGVLNRDFELEPTPVNDFSSLEYISFLK